MDILPYEPDPTQDAAQGGLTCDLCGWRGPLAAFVVSLEDYGELLPPGCRLVPPTGYARCADARARQRGQEIRPPLQFVTTTRASR